jgi:hypothetical protein
MVTFPSSMSFKITNQRNAFPHEEFQGKFAFTDPETYNEYITI